MEGKLCAITQSTAVEKGAFRKTKSLMDGGRNLYGGKVICLYNVEKTCLKLEWILLMRHYLNLLEPLLRTKSVTLNWPNL